MSKFWKYLFPLAASREAAERAYLDGSASLYDLERREREIEQGKFAPQNNRLYWPARYGEANARSGRFAGSAPL